MINSKMFCAPRGISASGELLRILRVARSAAQKGIRKIRITGGEPLVRRGIIEFIGELSRIPGIADLSITTNGVLLEASAEPLYRAGGHPGGLDAEYAHKISLVYNPQNATFYLYYCAVGKQGRCIGLITSQRIQGGTSLQPRRSPL